MYFANEEMRVSFIKIHVQGLCARIFNARCKAEQDKFQEQTEAFNEIFQKLKLDRTIKENLTFYRVLELLMQQSFRGPVVQKANSANPELNFQSMLLFPIRVGFDLY